MSRALYNSLARAQVPQALLKTPFYARRARRTLLDARALFAKPRFAEGSHAVDRLAGARRRCAVGAAALDRPALREREKERAALDRARARRACRQPLHGGGDACGRGARAF